jgi:hypothetical protein
MSGERFTVSETRTGVDGIFPITCEEIILFSFMQVLLESGARMKEKFPLCDRGLLKDDN